MGSILILIGILFLGFGWTLLYKPAWILYLNKIIREKLFNDGEMLLERRKKGFLFVLLAVIFLATGYDQQSYRSSRMTTRVVSTDRLLYKSLQHLYDKQYQKSRALCERVLAQDPGNVRALYHLAAAQILMGDLNQGTMLWAKAAAMHPSSSEAQSLKKLIRTEKGQLAQRSITQ